ncbi:MAG: hypothetical protein OHK0036_01870 [Bacteroidia bacterium]
MKKIKTKIKLGIAGLVIIQVIACSDSANNTTSQSTTTEVTTNSSGSENENTAPDIGVGPVKSVSLGDIDINLVNKGKEIFEAKCTACHEIDKKKVGPAIKGVTQRRKPEWIMNMILNPTEMTQKDPVAKELLGTYAAPMANQNLTEDEARAVLEYFRNIDK